MVQKDHTWHGYQPIAKTKAKKHAFVLGDPFSREASPKKTCANSLVIFLSAFGVPSEL